MVHAKLLVRHREQVRPEVLAVAFLPADRARAPGRIHQLPAAVVEPDGRPGVVAGVCRHGGVGSQRLVPESFAVPADDDALEPGVRRERGVQAGVPLAHGNAGGKGRGRRRLLDGAVEVVVRVVGDVVVQPGEDDARLVGEAVKGRGQLVREPAQVGVRNGLARVESCVCVRGGEVAAVEAVEGVCFGG